MRSLSGPASPKPLIASRTRRGLSSASRSSPSPSRSITPGRKFSTSTSAQRTSASTNARSPGSFRSMATLRLPRLTDRKYVLSAPSPAGTNGGPQCLVSSPAPGRSTLITSAPRSPRSIAAYGPASTRARSSTCTPVSGPAIASFPVPGGWLRRGCRQRGRRHHGHLLLQARRAGLEGAVRAEGVVVLVVVQVAACALVVDLLARLEERQAGRVRVARGARRVGDHAHVLGDRGAAGGLGEVIGQGERDHRVVGVVGVGQRAGRLLAREELVELVGERRVRRAGDRGPVDRGQHGVGGRVADRLEVVAAAGDVGADPRDVLPAQLLELTEEYGRGRRVLLGEDHLRVGGDHLADLAQVGGLVRGHY